MIYYLLAIAIFIIIILIPVVMVWGLIYAYKKLSRKYFLILIAIIVGSPYITFKWFERNFMLEVVPDALEVNSVTYNKEESWGFGPGGNEAGIRIYLLPEKISSTIKKQGIEFFHNMPQNRSQDSRRWRGLYSNWKETPIKPGKDWVENKESGQLNIYDYICRYGFCIDIEPTIVKEANYIINTPGSFYAYGRIGLIVVSPERNLVMYLYNG